MFDYAQFSAAFPWFFPLWALLFGACVGSFLNVVIYRLPKEESIVSPGSHCGCGQPIRWYDNLPILSWLLLRGRARCCGRAFSFRYPFVELLTALLFVACWLKFPPQVAVCGWIFLSCLIAATFIDLDHFIIPDVFTIGLGVCGVLLSSLIPALHGHGGGATLDSSLRSGLASLQGLLIGSSLVLWIGILAEAILRKQAMGFGDVKFVGAIGAFCGWQGAVAAVFGGACVGTVWVALAMAWQKVSGKRSPMNPPTEAPQEEDSTPAVNYWDVSTTGAGVIGVGISFLWPASYGQTSDLLAVNSLRAGTSSLHGLLMCSGVMLWLTLLLPFAFRNDTLAFSIIRFAGAIGAFCRWQDGVKGLAVAALWAAVAGLSVAGAWWIVALVRRKFPALEVTGSGSVAPVTDEPVPLGFGVHVPFGPMLAIAGGLYFLFVREWVAAWFDEVGMLF